MSLLKYRCTFKTWWLCQSTGAAGWNSRLEEWWIAGVWAERGRGEGPKLGESELQRPEKVENRKLEEDYRRGGGNRGWYLSVSGEWAWLSGVRQLALALLTLSREGWRSLEAPQHNMSSNGGRGKGDRRRGQTQREKTMDKQKKYFKRKCG